MKIQDVNQVEGQVETSVSETPEQELARLRAENATLKTKKEHGVTIQFSEKGCISVYGLGRFPISLYPAQWEKFLKNGTAELVQQFMQDNAERCAQVTANKPQSQKKPVAA